MEIRGERITLRPISMADLPDCTRWAGDMDIMQHVTGKTFTPEEERVWLENVLQKKEEIFITLNENGRAIGSCGVHAKSPRPELQNEEGMYLGILIGEKDQWGKGYGPEVMRLLSDYAHRTHDAKRIWLTVDAGHERAKRAYEKAGFTVVRRFIAPERTWTTGGQCIMEYRYE